MEMITKVALDDWVTACAASMSCALWMQQIYDNRFYIDVMAGDVSSYKHIRHALLVAIVDNDPGQTLHS